MDSFRSSAVDPVRFGASDACPFLGLEEDSQSHYHGETQEHFCHRVDPPLPVRISQQTSYCLSEAYEECPVFLYYHRGLTPEETRTAFATGWGAALENGISGLLGNRRILTIILGVILVPLVIIAISLGVSGILNRSNPSPSQEITLATPTVAELLSQIEPSATSTSAPTTESSVALAAGSSPTPTATEISTNTPTATITPTSTNTPLPVDCGLPEAYTFHIVEGPILTPEPGFVYGTGDIPPAVQASWIIENNSACDWERLAVYSLPSLRTFAPLIIYEGERIELSGNDPAEVVGPGGVIEIALSFSPELSRYVSSEFALVINGFRLLDQQYLILEVQNWVTRISATPTVQTSDPDPDDPKSTSEPDDRPVATPPSTRP